MFGFTVNESFLNHSVAIGDYLSSLLLNTCHVRFDVYPAHYLFAVSIALVLYDANKCASSARAGRISLWMETVGVGFTCYITLKGIINFIGRFTSSSQCSVSEHDPWDIFPGHRVPLSHNTDVYIGMEIPMSMLYSNTYVRYSPLSTLDVLSASARPDPT